MTNSKQSPHTTEAAARTGKLYLVGMFFSGAFLAIGTLKEEVYFSKSETTLSLKMSQLVKNRKWKHRLSLLRAIKMQMRMNLQSHLLVRRRKNEKGKPLQFDIYD